MPRRAATNKGCALLPRTEMPPEILPWTREPDLERHRTLRKSCLIRTLTSRPGIARLKRMAPSLAIARKYRGLHTGWETARATVQKAAQCRALAKRQHSRDF